VAIADDFWDDILGHIGQRELVPVVGPDLTIVNVGGAERILTTLIGERLAQRYELTTPSGTTTMRDAVEAFLRERGRDELERLYRVINDIIRDLDAAPGGPLNDLASITDLRLLVSTTPDRMLAAALNDSRFEGDPGTRELTFSPTQSTTELNQNDRPASSLDTVVVRLFGEATSTPQYAIHDEDRLEWLHALMSGAASLPDWLAYQLKQQPMLFIGCEIPDWIGRFLLRVTSNSRLSLERKQFFVVNSPTARVPSLSNFFATYCRKAQVQELEMAPDAFVAELRSRWEQQRPARPSAVARPLTAPPPGTQSIFISYMREDIAAARQLYDAITGIGGDVWLDEQRLRPGDAWESEILAGIRRTVRLFIPLISAHTEREEEGYVFREWSEAVDRARKIPRRRFIVPVIVDDDYDGDPSQYRQIREEFRQLHFGRAPSGHPDPALRALLTEEIRDMRRPDAT
jgi:hypothetical protein